MAALGMGQMEMEWGRRGRDEMKGRGVEKWKRRHGWGLGKDMEVCVCGGGGGEGLRVQKRWQKLTSFHRPVSAAS